MVKKSLLSEIHYVDAGYNKVGMPDPKNISLIYNQIYDFI